MCFNVARRAEDMGDVGIILVLVACQSQDIVENDYGALRRAVGWMYRDQYQVNASSQASDVTRKRRSGYCVKRLVNAAGYCPDDFVPLGEPAIGTPNGSGRPATVSPS